MDGQAMSEPTDLALLQVVEATIKAWRKKKMPTASAAAVIRKLVISQNHGPTTLHWPSEGSWKLVRVEEGDNSVATTWVNSRSEDSEPMSPGDVEWFGEWDGADVD